MRKVRSALWTLRGKRIGVLGLAFKGATDDIRESPAIGLIQMLLSSGCSLAAYDPAAMARAQEVFPPMKSLTYASDPYSAAQDVDALLILTDWAEFSQLDLSRLKSTMRYPIVIDGRNLFDPERMADHGFTYLSIGRPAANPVRKHSVGASETSSHHAKIAGDLKGRPVEIGSLRS